MSDWRDVMNARQEADTAAKYALDRQNFMGEAVVHALLAVRLELRALGVTIDYANGDTNVRV